MGNYGKIEEKQIAQKLRREGKSYGEILQTVQVSKDTLSRWCKNIVLTKEQEQRLVNSKIFGQRKGSLVAANNKRTLRVNKIKEIFKNSKKELGFLGKRDRFITGIALYAGEGSKTDGDGGFANSDPKLIKFMMTWFVVNCDLGIDKFRGSLWIHDNQDESEAKEFWSRLTGIPEKNFYKTYIAKNKPNSRKIRKNIHKYGVFAIKFSNRHVHRRIMGWISALFGDKIPPVR